MSVNQRYILFTGGGSAGHVTPNLALIEHFQNLGWRVEYAGSSDGIEKDIIAKTGIPYFGVASGKLRRYFSLQNFLDPFKILFGIAQAFKQLRVRRPDVVFSKGGFAAFPIVVAAWLNRIPVLCHESDFSPGLANRLSFPFAERICLTFAEGRRYFGESEKVVVTGTPLRNSLLNGLASSGRRFCGFSDKKPILLVIGGGLGARVINETIRQALPQLHQRYQVAHICGPGKLHHEFDNLPGYRQFEYLHEELPDVFAACDVIISRAGANSIYEFIALKKPHLLVPLSRAASRGDQILNAKHFAELGTCTVLPEEQMSESTLLKALDDLEAKRVTIEKALANYPLTDSVTEITRLIIESVDPVKSYQ